MGVDQKSFKGSVWDEIKFILKDGRTFPETAAIIFFSEKFVFVVRQVVRPAKKLSVILSPLSLKTHHPQLCGHCTAVLSVNPPHNSAATQSEEGGQRGQQCVRTAG